MARGEQTERGALASDEQEDDRARYGERDRAHDAEQAKLDLADCRIDMFHRCFLLMLLSAAPTKTIMIGVKVK